MAVGVDALLTEVKQLRIERDQAREEVGHEKAMRRFVSEERGMFIDRMKCAEDEAARWKAAWHMAESLLSEVERVRVVRNIWRKRANRAEAALARVRALVADTGNTSTGPTYALCADVLAAIERADS